MDSLDRPYWPGAEAALFNSLTHLRERKAIAAQDPALGSPSAKIEAIFAFLDRTKELLQIDRRQAATIIYALLTQPAPPFGLFGPGVNLSPDGTYLTITDEGRTGYVIAISTGAIVATFPARSDDTLEVAFISNDLVSLKREGSGSEYNKTTWEVFDIKSNVTIKLPSALGWNIQHVAAVPSSLNLIVVLDNMESQKSSISVFDRRAKSYVLTMDIALGSSLSPDGNLLLSPNNSGGVDVINLLTNKREGALAVQQSRARKILFSPSGRYVITISEDSSARVWQLYEKRLLKVLDEKITGHPSVSFSPDESRIAIIGEDRLFRMLSLSVGRVDTVVHKFETVVNFVTFLPWGGQMLTWSSDFFSAVTDEFSLRLWAVETSIHPGRCLLEKLPTPEENKLFFLNYSLVGEIISERLDNGASKNNLLKVWNASTGKLIFQYDAGENVIENAISIADAHQLIVRFFGGEFVILDRLEGGDVRIVGNLPVIPRSTLLGVSQDRSVVIVLSASKENVELRDITNWRLIHRISVSGLDLNDADISNDHRRGLLRSAGDEIYYVDFTTGYMKSVLLPSKGIRPSVFGRGKTINYKSAWSASIDPSYGFGARCGS
jgi:hypothetical protein